jgi:hypothetical protein
VVPPGKCLEVRKIARVKTFFGSQSITCAPEERRRRAIARNFIRESNDLRSFWEVVLDDLLDALAKHCQKNLPLFRVHRHLLRRGRACVGGGLPIAIPSLNQARAPVLDCAT